MSSTLVSYSSGEEDEDSKKRHADANYDDVNMDMSDDEAEASAAMFSSKEDYEAYQKQFNRKQPEATSCGGSQNEYGSELKETNQGKATSAEPLRRDRKDEDRRDKRRKDDSRRRDHHQKDRPRHRSRSRSRERNHHRRRSRDRDDRHHRDRRHNDDGRRHHRRSNNDHDQRQDTRNRKLQSLGLVGKGDETYESQLEKVKELTGVEVPKYYNPAAINPLRYAEQIKKRQMLWSKKPAGDEGEPEEQPLPTTTAPTSSGLGQKPAAAALGAAPTSFNKWETTNFGNDKTNEKFRRLMGIKGGGGGGGNGSNCGIPPNTDSSSANNRNPNNAAKWFADQEQQYEKARAITHTQRGLGLGFTSALPPGGPPPEEQEPPASSSSSSMHDKPRAPMISFMKK